MNEVKEYKRRNYFVHDDIHQKLLILKGYYGDLTKSRTLARLIQQEFNKINYGKSRKISS